MILRPYQIEALDRLRDGLRSQVSGLIVMACGSGKGSIIAHIVNTCVLRGKRVIFAVHGKALVHDMSQRVHRLGIKHGVLIGGHRRERWHPVQVASIDTLHRMEFPPKADLLIIDECHGSTSPTWRRVVGQYPQAKVIGSTATPIRLDRQGLGRKSGGLFDFMVLGPTEQELIDMGYLVPSRVLAPPPPADLSNVGKVAGEFNSKQQASVCDRAKVIGDIVEHWKKHASDRKTASFGVDQAHALHIAEQFRENGIQWAYVDAETPDVERDKIWRDLDNPASGLMGVSSVGCISVGWDHPIVSCLIAARKTASLGLWRQMLGRGSRTYQGKKDFLVLDHVGNTHHHYPYGLFEDPVDWQLDGDAINKKEKDEAPSVTTCRRPAVIDGILKLPCYATFKTRPKECPYCGLPILVATRKIEQVNGELQEVTAEHRKLTEKERIMRAVYESLRLEGQKRGYKDGWASIQYKRQMGQWPATKRWGDGNAGAEYVRLIKEKI